MGWLPASGWAVLLLLLTRVLRRVPARGLGFDDDAARRGIVARDKNWPLSIVLSCELYVVLCSTVLLQSHRATQAKCWRDLGAKLR